MAIERNHDILGTWCFHVHRFLCLACRRVRQAFFMRKILY
nr:MAG TPA: hypothetical protein [Caudoviricetes sp.]